MLVLKGSATDVRPDGSRTRFTFTTEGTAGREPTLDCITAHLYAGASASQWRPLHDPRRDESSKLVVRGLGDHGSPAEEFPLAFPARRWLAAFPEIPKHLEYAICLKIELSGIEWAQLVRAARLKGQTIEEAASEALHEGSEVYLAQTEKNAPLR